MLLYSSTLPARAVSITGLGRFGLQVRDELKRPLANPGILWHTPTNTPHRPLFAGTLFHVQFSFHSSSLYRHHAPLHALTRTHPSGPRHHRHALILIVVSKPPYFLLKPRAPRSLGDHFHLLRLTRINPAIDSQYALGVHKPALNLDPKADTSSPAILVKP